MNLPEVLDLDCSFEDLLLLADYYGFAPDTREWVSPCRVSPQAVEEGWWVGVRGMPQIPRRVGRGVSKALNGFLEGATPPRPGQSAFSPRLKEVLSFVRSKEGKRAVAVVAAFLRGPACVTEPTGLSLVRMMPLGLANGELVILRESIYALLLVAAYYGFEPDRAEWLQTAQREASRGTAEGFVGWWTGWPTGNFVTQEEAQGLTDALTRAKTGIEPDRPGSSVRCPDLRSALGWAHMPQGKERLAEFVEFLQGGEFHAFLPHLSAPLEILTHGPKPMSDTHQEWSQNSFCGLERLRLCCDAERLLAIVNNDQLGSMEWAKAAVIERGEQRGVPRNSYLNEIECTRLAGSLSRAVSDPITDSADGIPDPRVGTTNSPDAIETLSAFLRATACTVSFLNPSQIELVSLGRKRLSKGDLFVGPQVVLFLSLIAALFGFEPSRPEWRRFEAFERASGTPAESLGWWNGWRSIDFVSEEESRGMADALSSALKDDAPPSLGNDVAHPSLMTAVDWMNAAIGRHWAGVFRDFLQQGGFEVDRAFSSEGIHLTRRYADGGSQPTLGL